MICLFINSTPEGQRRKKTAISQKKIVYNYLLENTATGSMIEEATGVKQKNVTRYKDELQRLGLLYEVYNDYCETTGHKAWYLSTNPDNDPFRNQLKLDFENDQD